MRTTVDGGTRLHHRGWKAGLSVAHVTILNGVKLVAPTRGLRPTVSSGERGFMRFHFGVVTFPTERAGVDRPDKTLGTCLRPDGARH